MSGLSDEIRILKENPVYRVTDIVFRRGNRWQIDRETIIKDNSYEGTILRDYLEQKRFENDLRTFNEVVRFHQDKYEKTPSNRTVLHLRLGDVMDSVHKRSVYKISKRLYGSFPFCNLLKTKAITIVTAMHFGADHITGKYGYSDNARERSIEIFEYLHDILTKQGFDVSLKSTNNVDEDLCFMAGSNEFIKSISHLSVLVSYCMQPRTRIWDIETQSYYDKSKLDLFIKEARIMFKRSLGLN